MTHARLPLYALIATVVFVIAAVVIVLLAPPSSQSTVIVLGFIASTVPSLVAAFASEKTNRDIANGVLTDKARQGTVQALHETGVTHAVSESDRTTTAALEALTRLLEKDTDNG